MRLNVIQAGERRDQAPLVLLHGLFGQARNLGRLQRTLAAEQWTLAFDLRSHGASPAGPLALTAMADDVLETLQDLHIGRASLLGHSMGGKVAMAAALAAPHAVSALLVADIAPVAYDHGNARYARALQALVLTPGLTRAAADAALARTIADAPVRALLLQNLMVGERPHWRIGLDDIAQSIDQVEGWPDWHHEARFGGPALFVRAERSDYVRPEWFPATRSLFPRARFVTLRDAGHWLHVDKPAEFASIVTGFLRAVRSSAHSA